MHECLRLGVNAILTNDSDDTVAVLGEPKFIATKRLAIKSRCALVTYRGTAARRGVEDTVCCKKRAVR